jgi:hypothetical protein
MLILSHILVWLNVLALTAVIAACFKYHELNWDNAHFVVSAVVLMVALGAFWTIADILAARIAPELSSTVFRLALAAVIVIRAFFPKLLRGDRRAHDRSFPRGIQLH